MAPRSERSKTRRRSPHCSRCDKAIRVPKGWSGGSAVRKHYWRHHRDVMERRA